MLMEIFEQNLLLNNNLVIKDTESCKYLGIMIEKDSGKKKKSEWENEVEGNQYLY